MRLIVILGSVAALAFAAPAANAAVTPIGTLPPAEPFFYITGSAPGFSYVTAQLGDTFSGVTTFDDTFTFTLPKSGIGSGSVSTSFSSMATMLTISTVTINGVSFTAAQAALGVSGIPITAGMLNTIEVMGTSGSVLSTYSGTATFTAAAVPEPVTWATFLVGFGFMGFALRRRLAGNLKTA